MFPTEIWQNGKERVKQRQKASKKGLIIARNG
jgi:hypothetical protein